MSFVSGLYKFIVLFFISLKRIFAAMQSRKSNPKFLKSTKLAEPYQKLGMKTVVLDRLLVARHFACGDHICGLPALDAGVFFAENCAVGVRRDINAQSRCDARRTWWRACRRDYRDEGTGYVRLGC